MLKLKNITKDYFVGDNVVHALKGVNLEFRKNEFVSVLGPSGCGKTTLLNIVGGLDKYTSGDLIINNKSTKDFNDYNWDSYRNHSVGFVFQTYNLIPHQTVLGNVELALTLSGISKTERKKRAIEALESVGLNDQLYKRPNQLSGGQMQRVAIARSLVNNPDILLADEPTGALDTETSVQIMEILKKISQDRLIIMVTHNPDLANKYSTRIVRLLDGLIISDSNPYEDKRAIEAKTMTKKEKQVGATSMSFFTALSLSLKNLITKKGRTFLTAFAGSIGIIGIALVLALSNGFQTYINKMQSDTLSSYPLKIEEESMDLSSLMEISRADKLDKFPLFQKVIINKISERFSSMFISNNFTPEYIENVIEKIDSSLIYGITYTAHQSMNIYKSIDVNGNITYKKISVSNWNQIINNEDFISSQYDIICGDYPTSKNDIVLVVDEYNRISDSVLNGLGLYTYGSDIEEMDFEDLIGIEYKLLLNNGYYMKDSNIDKWTAVSTNQEIANVYNDSDVTITLKVSGILRVNPETSMGAISGSVGYTKELFDYFTENSLGSDIVQYQKTHRTYDVLKGIEFISDPLNPLNGIEAQYLASMKKIGGSSAEGVFIPKSIDIYPASFDAKARVKEYLDDYNDSVEETQRVFYQDNMQILLNSLNQMVDIISYVLIAFTAISLVVSSIMIGIITYVSVLERTKEIGVLRSIGARKKDISRVFNAETIIIGFVAGMLGVIVTLLLTIPINIILINLAEIGNLATLKIVHALVLVLISIFLTLISGLIPSRVAAKKDPVVALRTE